MRPYYDDGRGIVIWNADCRDVLPTLESGSVDLVLTDPPYGVGKASWDTEFPLEWLALSEPIARIALAVMPGITNILSLPRRVGRMVYKWTISIHITNAIVRGAIGFGNWLPCLVYAPEDQSLYTCNQDATQIAISGKMPDHPSPKPYQAMKWLVSRLPGESILDPFMGSGTTLRAAKDLGRRAIGIEIEEKYCRIAVQRLEQECLPLGVKQIEQRESARQQEVLDL